MNIKERLNRILSTLPKGVQLVAVSKFHPAERLQEAYDAGQRIFGESRPQEMVAKYDVLPKDIEWHMIGHLQTNKVKYIAPFVTMISSVDSDRLIEEIEKQAAKNNRTIDILLEVHVAQEETKSGWSEEELRAYLASGILNNMAHVRVRGVISYFAEHENERKDMTIITGFKSANDILFKDDFPMWRQKMNVILTLDNGAETEAHKIGLVTKYIPDLQLQDVSKAAAIVVGPPAMMRFSVKGLLERGFQEENIWISHERKMCCGLGKCGHCKVNDTYICLDGPVFNYTKGKTLID